MISRLLISVMKRRGLITLHFLLWLQKRMKLFICRSTKTQISVKFESLKKQSRSIQ